MGAYLRETFQGNRYTNSRRNFIFGCAAAGGLGVLAACGGGRASSPMDYVPNRTLLPGEQNLLELMRKTGVAAIDQGATFAVLPEYRSIIVPSRSSGNETTCGQTPESVGTPTDRRVAAVCSSPAPTPSPLLVIAIAPSVGPFNEGIISSGGSAGFFTLVSTLYGPGVTNTGPTITGTYPGGVKPSPAPNCTVEALATVISGVASVAQGILASPVFSMISKAAAKNLLNNPLTLTSIGEFLALVLGTLVSSEWAGLLGFLSAAGLSLLTIYELIKCASGH